MNRPVLAAIDTPERSGAAAHWAAAEALRRGAPLRLLHAWPNSGNGDQLLLADLREAARRMLDGLADELRAAHPGVEVATSVVAGAAVDALLRAATECELLVLGTRGLGGFHGLLVGSVSLSTVGRCDTPVVLVRAEMPPNPRAAQHAVPRDAVPEVVVGLDPQVPAGPVLDFAFEEAARRGAPVHVVHGWETPPTYNYGYAAGWVPSQEDRRLLETLATRLVSDALAPWREKYPQVLVVEDVRAGGAAGALVDAAGEAALFVVGRRDRSLGVGPRLGPVAHAVIHHAPAPVAVVPHA
ncbi:universal stress protein [Kitasatospora nipponensis]